MYASSLKAELNSQWTVVFHVSDLENGGVVQRINEDLHDPGP